MKIACNNVYPKTYEWTGDIPINNLLYDICTGNSQYRGSSNDKLLKISRLAYEYKEKYGGEWDDKTDLYNENSPRNGKTTDKYDKLSKEFIDGIYKKGKEYHIYVFGYAVTSKRGKRLGYGDGKPMVFSEEQALYIQGRYSKTEIRAI